MTYRHWTFRAAKTAALLIAANLPLACGISEQTSSTTLEDQGAATGPVVYAALEPIAQNRDENTAYMAVSASEALTDSVVLCLAPQATCTAGQGTRIPTRLIDSNGRRVHVASERLQVQPALIVTVLGRTTAGTDLVRQFRFDSTSPGTQDGTQDGTQPGFQGSDCYRAPDEFICQVEVQIANFTNEFRQRNGLAPLVFDNKFGFVSRLWSTEQARRGAISHDWFSNGRWAQEYVREFNEQPRLAGENVAMSSGIGGDATDIARTFVNMWINSPGHRRNMLSNFATIGVGAARIGSAWYATQNFGY